MKVSATGAAAATTAMATSALLLLLLSSLSSNRQPFFVVVESFSLNPRPLHRCHSTRIPTTTTSFTSSGSSSATRHDSVFHRSSSQVAAPSAISALSSSPPSSSSQDERETAQRPTPPATETSCSSTATTATTTTSTTETTNNKSYDDSIRRGLRRLAQLSLEDYDWRRSVFKETEADRKVEESLARILGEENASYFRPMDASEGKIGPLGRAEKAAVDWLSRVIDEEGRRAKKIVNTDGRLVRPIEAGDGLEGTELGPLGTLERQVVEWLDSVRASEKRRAERGVWRPKDLDESTRGPLGQLESAVVSALRTIQESEILRMEQSRLRGGEVVRPIDVPGPLGEFELAVADMIQTERLRARERQEKESLVRPKDATVKGKLGEIEMQAVEAVRRLTEEERERLRNIQRRLADSRPMLSEKPSLLGILESLVVGILRGPALLIGVFQRVMELLSSESLDEKDKAILDSQRTDKNEKGPDKKGD